MISRWALPKSWKIVHIPTRHLIKNSYIDKNGKFQPDFSKLLRSFLERCQKRKITNCLYFFQILKRSASKMLPKLEKLFLKLTHFYHVRTQFWHTSNRNIKKRKSSLLLYFFKIFPNLLSKIANHHFEIYDFHWYGVKWGDWRVGMHSKKSFFFG